MLVKFEHRMLRTIQNFEFFDKNWLTTIFDNVLTSFWKMFLGMEQLIDAKILI